MLAISSNGLASRAPDKLVLHDCTQLGAHDASAHEIDQWVGVLCERTGDSWSLQSNPGTQCHVLSATI